MIPYQTALEEIGKFLAMTCLVLGVGSAVIILLDALMYRPKD